MAICVISAIFILKIRGLNVVKIWFAGFFFYAFCEILFFIKMMLESETLFNSMIFSEWAYNLYDNQHLYRLYLCAGVIFLIYCALFILEKKKFYAVFAGVNLLLASLLILFLPDIGDILLYGDESTLELSLVLVMREAGILIYMLNIFVFGLYKLYDER